MKPNMTAEEGREVARSLIVERIRDHEQRKSCLDELARATPIHVRNGWRFIVPSFYPFDDEGGTASVIDRGFARIEVTSREDTTFDF